jgi:hypothetical protein
LRRGWLELRCTNDERPERSRSASVRVKMKGNGVLLSRSKGFIADDEDGPVWGHNRAVRPPVTSWLAGDSAMHWMACEAYARRLIGGDLSHLNRPGQTVVTGRPNPPIQIAFSNLQNCSKFEIKFRCLPLAQKYSNYACY